MRFHSVALLASLFSLVAGATHPQTKDRLDRRDKLFGYEAVGLLESSRGNCTAALIARDVALTAAHCVYGKEANLTFRMAFSDGASLATRRVEDVAIAKGYIEAVARRNRRMENANDVALVRLASPIYDAGTNPFEIASAPRTGTELTLASYGRGRMGALTLERGCELEKFYRGGVVEIDCDATFGSSGAPVFFQSRGRTRIFAIVTSGIHAHEAEDGQAVTYGVQLTEIVPDLLQDLQKKRALAPVSTGARRVTVGDRTLNGGGITFVRPGDND